MIKKWKIFNEDRTGWKGSDFQTPTESRLVADFKSRIEELIEKCDGKIQVLKDNYYDEYAGPHADVKINGKFYEIWTAGDDKFFIKDYPINNSEEDFEDGFTGTIDEICELITPSFPYPAVAPIF